MENKGAGQRGKYSMRNTSRVCTESNFTTDKDIKLKLLDTFSFVRKCGLTFPQHRHPTRYFEVQSGHHGDAWVRTSLARMRFAVEEENESRVFVHVCTKAVIMLYYNCQLCFVSAASHYSPSFIKFCGKYRQG